MCVYYILVRELGLGMDGEVADVMETGTWVAKVLEKILKNHHA